VDDVGLVEFASESGDGDPDGVGEWVDVLVPRLREELLCAELLIGAIAGPIPRDESARLAPFATRVVRRP
jgi:hypothetical protein